MAEPKDVELNPDELEALKGVARNFRDQPAKQVDLSYKALDHGLVTRGEDGVLRITAAGRRRLRRAELSRAAAPTAVTNARWESSHRAIGVAFDAENENGRAEFVVAREALEDLVGGHDMSPADYMDAFESFADEISEAAASYLATGVTGRDQLTVITNEDLPSK